jgi:hypothetical protein
VAFEGPGLLGAVQVALRCASGRRLPDAPDALSAIGYGHVATHAEAFRADTAGSGYFCLLGVSINRPPATTDGFKTVRGRNRDEG